MIPDSIISSQEYEKFAYVDFKNATVSYLKNGQYVKYQFADVFECGSGSLICFKPQNIEEGAKHNFLVSNSESSEIIQASTYESLIDLFTIPDEYPYSFFTFLKSVYIPANSSQNEIGDVDHSINGAIFERCDKSSYGPIPFYPVQSGYSIARIRHVLSLSGIGHILHFNTMNTEIPNQTSQVVNMSGRTLTSILKCVFEWAEVANEPFNSTEEPAVSAKTFVNQLGIDENIAADVKSLQQNMRVFRYLEGNTKLFELFDESKTIPTSVTNYFMSHLSFETLSSLKKNHPCSSNIEIQQQILDEEKEKIEFPIFQYLLQNNINTETFKSSEFSNIILFTTSASNVPKNLTSLITKVRAYE